MRLELFFGSLEFRFPSVELANGAAFCWSRGVFPEGGQKDVHKGLREGFGFCSFGWGDVAGCAMYTCFGCGIQVDVLLADVLDQVSQED